MSNIGVLNDTKSTPLHVAAGNGHRYVVEYLLGCPGINLDAVDVEGRTPLLVCLENKSNEWRTTAHLLSSSTQSKENVDSPHIYKRRSTIQIELEEIPELIESIQFKSGVQGEVILEEVQEELDEHLDARGSLANIADDDDDTSQLKKSMTIRKVDISFMNGHHQVANFYKGKATTAAVALQDTCRLIHLDYSYQYVFALWIVSKSFALQLGDIDKPLKLIESWSTLMSRFCKDDTNETPHLYLRRNVFLAVTNERSISDGVALQYLYFDALNHVLSGYYPTTEEEALQLATITMKLEYGDFNPDIHNTKFMKDRLTTLLPAQHTKGKKRQQLERKLLAKYKFDKQRESGKLMLYNSYLEICHKWPYYGSSFYEGTVSIKVYHATSETHQTKSVRKVKTRLGINALGFHFINKESNVPMSSYALDTMKWDLAGNKQEFILESLDKSLQITVQSKQASLLYSMATQMKNELDTVKITLDRSQY
ncbi:PREDICTED: FERM domain-containing protein 8-like [Amphimedon queenslandica]|nr:PREDICTED: FERM domain-containing protein 8-like [Amphimedon queenslandica]|eukprot:XP_019848679.1 PREDICTED: FERM domain-containing protein 8-like [Amphimedon queenslandica]